MVVDEVCRRGDREGGGLASDWARREGGYGLGVYGSERKEGGESQRGGGEFRVRDEFRRELEKKREGRR